LGFFTLPVAIRRLRRLANSLSLVSLICKILYIASSSYSSLSPSLQQSRKIMTKVIIAKLPEPAIPYNLITCSVDESVYIYKNEE